MTTACPPKLRAALIRRIKRAVGDTAAVESHWRPGRANEEPYWKARVSEPGSPGLIRAIGAPASTETGALSNLIDLVEVPKPSA